MFDVRFIHTERLNWELHAFLLEAGFPAADVAFVPELGRILPDGKGRTERQRWEHYYTPELKAEVRRRERWLFLLFPE